MTGLILLAVVLGITLRVFARWIFIVLKARHAYEKDLKEKSKQNIRLPLRPFLTIALKQAVLWPYNFYRHPVSNFKNYFLGRRQKVDLHHVQDNGDWGQKFNDDD